MASPLPANRKVKDLIRMKCKFLAPLVCCGLLMLSTQTGLAQNYIANTGNGPDNPDWVEEAAETPPSFSTKNLLAIDVPPYMSSKVGVDPDTLVVGNDGVVRYVMVMSNASGNVSAVYEGLRCATNEVKTYARFGSNATWSAVQNPVWKEVSAGPAKLAQLFARQAACINYVAGTKVEIVTALKNLGQPKEGSHNRVQSGR